jgi:hypothetical protein
MLVSFDNPTGSITNSDLELAGRIAHQDILAQEVNIAEANLATGTDNTPTLAWTIKGSTTTTRATAFLLRLSAFHQRFHRYQMQPFYIPGPLNRMADDTSRLWKLDDSQLIAHFNAVYPQNESWQVRHLRPAMNSALISSLRCERQPPEEIFRVLGPEATCGQPGVPSVHPLALTKCSAPSKTPSLSSKCSLGDTAMGESLNMASQSALSTLRMSYDMLAGRSQSWAHPTLA